jgi:hypothetical protein
VPSLLLCAKKNSIPHPKPELNYVRRVGSFGKWHEVVMNGELMGYFESTDSRMQTRFPKTTMLQVSIIAR